MEFKKIAVDISKLMYRLDNQVMVDSKKMSSELKLATENIPFNSSLRVLTQESKTVKLVKGLPSFFKLKMNLKDLAQERSKKFPLKFFIFKVHDYIDTRLAKKNMVEKSLEGITSQY